MSEHWTPTGGSWRRLLRAVQDLLLDLKFWQAALALAASIRRALSRAAEGPDSENDHRTAAGEAGR